MWIGPGDRWSWGLGRNCVHLLLHREDHKVPGEFSESFPRCPMIPMLNYGFTVIHPLIIKNTNHLGKWSHSLWRIISTGSTLTQSISKVWFLTTFTARFWLENCALGLRHVWEESASASDLRAVVMGIWDILRRPSCHVAYCIKSDAWTHQCIKNRLDVG